MLVAEAGNLGNFMEIGVDDGDEEFIRLRVT